MVESAGSAGLYNSGRNDLSIIEINKGASSAAVFTTNSFCAAPVHVAQQHLARTMPRYCLINAGNANAGTGEKGITDCEYSCKALSELAGCRADELLPFSTGVIGKYLQVDKLCEKMPDLLENLSSDNWINVAEAIMTTDTVPKGISRTMKMDEHSFTVSGIAKGSGMIKPDMATMLAFVATDAEIREPVLQDILLHAINGSFNRICVDGDTSTNDACVLVATGLGGTPAIDSVDH